MTLGGQIHLDHFKHAARQFIAALHVAKFAFLLLAQTSDARPELAVHGFRFGFRVGGCLDPLGGEAIDLLQDNFSDIAGADLLARAWIDHFSSGDLHDFACHLAE